MKHTVKRGISAKMSDNVVMKTDGGKHVRMKFYLLWLIDVMTKYILIQASKTLG